MTEALFYPLSALALLAVARAVETATRPRPGHRARADRHRRADARAGGRRSSSRSPRRSCSTRCSRATRPKIRAFWPVWTTAAAGLAVALATPGHLRRLRGHGRRLLPARRRPAADVRPLRVLRPVDSVAPFAALRLPADRGLPGPRTRPPGAGAHRRHRLRGRARHGAGRVLRRPVRTAPAGTRPRLAPAAALPHLRALAVAGATRGRACRLLAAFAVLALIATVPWNSARERERAARQLRHRAPAAVALARTRQPCARRRRSSASGCSPARSAALCLAPPGTGAGVARRDARPSPPTRSRRR